MTKTNKKERINIPILVAGAILAVIVGIFLIEFAKIIAFNKSENINVVSFDENGYTDGPVTITLSKRLGQRFSWKTESVNSDSHEKFVASVVDVVIENKSDETVEDWSIRFDVPKHCYIGNAISGDVEIHQVQEGDDEKVQIIDFEKINAQDIILKHAIDNDRTLIELNSGDYFIYHPENDIDEQVITPMSFTNVNRSERQVSLVIYTSERIDSADILSNCSLTYSLRRDFTRQNVFWYLVLLLGAWGILSLLVFIYERRRKRMDEALKLEEHILDTTVQAFSRIIDESGPIKGHSIRTAKAAKKMALALGYSKKRARNVYYAAKLHDCGMALVPDMILFKHGELTFEEYEEVKMHPSKGYEALRAITDLHEAAIAAKYHHERYDGTGYPEGKKGNDIPEIARILAIVDAWDSMANNRVYRKRKSPAEIRSELIKNSGTQFDSQLVALFLELVDKGEIVMEEDYDRESF